MKKVLKVVLVIFLLFIIYIGYNVYIDLKEEDKIKDEIVLINNLINDDNVEKRLNTYVTKNDYLKVEIAIKRYYKDYLLKYNELEDSYNIDNIYKLFSIDNYLKDKPNFNISLLYINETYKTCIKLYNDLNNMLDKDKLNEYLDSNIDEYYKEFTDDLMLNNIKKMKNDLENGKSDYIVIMDNIINVFEYLKDNKDMWYIENDILYFTNEENKDTYNELLSKVTFFEDDFKQNI